MAINKNKKADPKRANKLAQTKIKEISNKSKPEVKAEANDVHQKNLRKILTQITDIDIQEAYIYLSNFKDSLYVLFEEICMLSSTSKANKM